MVTYAIGRVRTGHPNAKLIKRLKRSIGQYSRGAKAEYIGKTSGEDGAAAMASRYDDEKKKWKINTMTLLYKSKSADNADKVERKLVDYSRKEHAISKNSMAGGTGREPDGADFYYVYAAYRR